MNLAALLKLALSLLEEKPKGKGRNLSRVSLLTICTAILWTVWPLRELPAKLDAVDKRLVRVESRLGLALVERDSVEPLEGRDSAAPALDRAPTNRFVFLHK